MEGGGGSFAKFYLQFWQQLFMSYGLFISVNAPQ